MSRKKTNHKIFENITVVDVGSQGKSIAKAPDGRVIFLTNAVPGDVVDIQTGRQRKSYYEGKVIKYHHLSDQRDTPICKHFEVCGGCKWQNLQYPHQLAYKQNEVVNNLIRIGHLELPEITPIFGAKDPYYYRNKMEFSFSSNRWLTYEEIGKTDEIENRHACGFHIAGMWDKILDIEFCHLQREPSNAIRNFTKQFAIDHQITFFNPKTMDGMMRTLLIRISSLDEIMVVVQFFQNDKTQINLVMEALKNQFPEITSLQYIVNNKQNDTIYDQDVILFNGRDHIYETMEGLKFKINAKSFYQTNSNQAYELYKITRDFASLKGDELVYDLYTGTGTIAQFIAKKAKKVVGIESVPEAITDAKFNAQNNNINNVDFFVGDMKSVFSSDFIQQNGLPDVIITDPPRDGMHKDVVEQILSVKPVKIVYVSCNSATQARDLALMNDLYKITKTQAVDMFPQTHHVENVVLLELR
ncbi:MAG: 23S rRNA (uracil(1939)-C(5))-methyltransferase RlmD [Flavobacteriaceae bacterium]|nr:23S rRNA (uracil(1939)-C(5))-methyltransferase RlmD [Flavobacteriaceae bacterium]